MSALIHDIRRRISKNISPIGTSGEYAYSSPQALMVPETVNEAEMSAEFVIVSKVEDREYDVITPQGCEEYLDEYRRNPVVLLEHDALKPIGLSTDKAGTFHFRVTPDRIIAKCFFHCLPLNGENLSEEVFRLVTKGVFRGASPGFLPIRASKRGYAKDSGYEYSAWRLTEWSITSQPVNQDALRLSLSGVRCKSLKRTLESLVIKPSPVVRGGFTGTTVSKSVKSFDESKHPRDGGKFTSGHHSGEASKHAQAANTAATERRKYYFGKKPSEPTRHAHDATRVAHHATESKNAAAADLHRRAERAHFAAWEHHDKNKNATVAEHHNNARQAHMRAAHAHDAEKKGTKAMKPKTASIEFDKSIFTEEKAAVAWLNQHGYDSSSCVPLPASFVFKQAPLSPSAGRKSLGTGVTAILAKSFDESKHPRDGGKFASGGGHSSSDDDHHKAGKAAENEGKKANKILEKHDDKHPDAGKAAARAARAHSEAAEKYSKVAHQSPELKEKQRHHETMARRFGNAHSYHTSKSILFGKGPVSLITKAFKDDDEDKDMKDEEKPDMEDEKIEKDAPDEEDDDDELDDVEDGDAEDDADGDEGEEAEGEDSAEEETQYDPEALKKEADNLVDMIAHFEIACEHAERMKGESVKSPELFDKLHADATALVADLRAAYKDGFADQAMESAIEERKAGATEKEEMPADSADATPDEYKEAMKSLKAVSKGLNEANVTAKSLPRAVA